MDPPVPRWSGMEAVITPLRRAAGWIDISHQFSRSIASLLHPLSRMGTVFYVSPTRAPVAQLDRASDFGSEGCRFKSCPVHHLFAGVLKVFRQSCSNLSSRPSSKQLSQLMTRTTRTGNEREPHQGHNLPETKSVRNRLLRGTPRQEPKRRIPRQGIRPE